MVKKMLSSLILFLFFSSCVAAKEVEKTDDISKFANGMFVMQGVDQNNIIWTMSMDSEHTYATVSLLADSIGKSTKISGQVEYNPDTFTIIDNEDNKEYTFEYEVSSGSDMELNYEPTESNVVLSTVTWEIAKEYEGYDYYAGMDADGNCYTIGLDAGKTKMILNILSTSSSESIIFVGDYVTKDAKSITFYTEDGEEFELGMSYLAGTDKQIDYVINGSEFIASLVDMTVLD